MHLQPSGTSVAQPPAGCFPPLQKDLPRIFCSLSIVYKPPPSTQEIMISASGRLQHAPLIIT